MQVFEVGTQTMLSSGAIYPVFQLMKDQQIKIDWDDFISVVKSYYSKGGNLYSMPFNSSTPILYYNKTTFEKAGLNPMQPPATFEEIEKCAKAAVSKGITKIGFTTAWPSWTLVENMHTWHDQPFADHQNGFTGMATQLKINEKLGIQVFEILARWKKELHLFRKRQQGGPAHYQRGGGGRLSVNGPGRNVDENRKVRLGDRQFAATRRLSPGKLDYRRSQPLGDERPQEGNVQGRGEVPGISRPAGQQAWWHANTGYFPVYRAAIKALPPDKFPTIRTLWTAFAQITKGKTTPSSRGHRLGNFAAVRDTIEAEMENVLAGKPQTGSG